MDSTAIIEMFRSFLIGCFYIVFPALAVSLIVATIVGVIQAVMQIQEQTLSFFPKLIFLFGTIYVTGPWMFDRMIKLFENYMNSIPTLL